MRLLNRLLFVSALALVLAGCSYAVLYEPTVGVRRIGEFRWQLDGPDLRVFVPQLKERLQAEDADLWIEVCNDGGEPIVLESASLLGRQGEVAASLGSSVQSPLGAIEPGTKCTFPLFWQFDDLLTRTLGRETSLELHFRRGGEVFTLVIGYRLRRKPWLFRVDFGDD
jgi:hypothetical protein